MELSPGCCLQQALTAVPHVSIVQWRASSWLVRWLVSARASVLVMTFSAAALGGLLAQLSAVQFDGLAWLGCLIGLLLAHAANNQLNDLTDSARGIDEGNYFRTRYGAHVLDDGLLRRKALWRYIGITARQRMEYAQRASKALVDAIETGASETLPAKAELTGLSDEERAASLMNWRIKIARLKR